MATVRAMHSRCCWPPERLETAHVELVLDLVPQGRAPQSVLDAGVEVGFGQLLVETHAEGDVLVDGHGEWRRLLEHHADLGAEQIDVLVRAQDVLAVEQHLAFRPLIGIKVVHAVEDAQQRGLAAAGRADEGRHLVLVEVDVVVGERAVLAVIEIQPAHRDLRFQRGGIARHRGRLFHVGMDG